MDRLPVSPAYIAPWGLRRFSRARGSLVWRAVLPTELMGRALLGVVAPVGGIRGRYMQRASGRSCEERNGQATLGCDQPGQYVLSLGATRRRRGGWLGCRDEWTGRRRFIQRFVTKRGSYFRERSFPRGQVEEGAAMKLGCLTSRGS